MNVLVACEESGTVRDAFRAKDLRWKGKYQREIARLENELYSTLKHES